METWILVGLVLTGIMTLISFCRMIVYLKANRRQQALRDPWVIFPGICSLLCGNDPYAYSPYFPVIQQKLVFHCLIFFSIILQFPVYIIYAFGLEEDIVFRALYIIKIISYWLLFCGFCLVINLWASLVIFNTGSCWILVLRRSLVTICIFFVALCLYACVDCLISRTIWTWLESNFYLIFSSLAAGVLALLSVGFLVVGCMLQGRICRALAPQEKGQPRFWATITRLNVTTLLCTLCFALRAMLQLVCLTSDSLADTISEWYAAPPLGLTELQWYALSEWIPHYLPCLALIYLMRNAGGAAEVHSWGYNQRSREQTPAYGTVNI
mmetsp:Transcript_22559/g.29533  ORF Transcript_22559/g.29533 Transcript_22559/m.29533 type:complete len:325 (-) Transcript_22559:180-1154(-)